MGTFYITTPIYYVNDVPHIGHAYTTIAADVLARHFRQRDRDVFFLTGVDEHGQKVQQAAAKAGIDPQTYCNNMVPQFQSLWNRLNVSNDEFIRTTHPQHKAIVQSTLQNLSDKKLIYSAPYTGWYCTFDERFWTEKDVVEGLCPDCKRPVERLSETNYFFKMGQYKKQLERYITEHYNPPDPFIGPQSRCNEVLGFLKKPLEDLSISRPKSRLSWGIELPFDPSYVTYVWFDALMNYVSALRYLTPESKQDPERSFNHYWTSKTPQSPALREHTVVHLVGKDILTTHAVYWSTMLMALELPLPTTIYAHGWWTVNGEKMSKSRSNVVDPNTIIEKFGVDAFRYFLLREVPFGQDGDFSEKALINRINSDLADGLGNLVSRTLTMIERYADNKIPALDESVYTPVDKKFMGDIGTLSATAWHHIGQLKFNLALEAIWEIIIQKCDQYIEQSAPWKLAKKSEDKAQLHAVLHNLAFAIYFLLPFLYPFMPHTAENIARQLGLRPKFIGKKIVWGKFAAGLEITKGQPLFPRIETTTSTKGAKPVNQDTPASPSPTPAPVPAAAPAQITIEDFQKIQLKVAKVLAAERVPKSEKLIKLQVDLGTEQRQVVAGIGKK
ncbi:MAG: methionine--tRNA ligase, partial [Nitrospirae bacterium]|nr:methionine--tRNA ligase [Nitrospirota bacterium]